MFFYIASTLVIVFLVKRFRLLKYYGMNIDLENNDYPFTTMDLHTINQNFNCSDYKDGYIVD